MSRRSRLVSVLALVSVTLLSAGCTKFGTGGYNGNKWSNVEYSVSGSGQAEVRYAATATQKLTTEVGAELPFSVSVRTYDHSKTVYTVVGKNGTAPLGCKIKVNGVVVDQEHAAAGKPVICSFVK